MRHVSTGFVSIRRNKHISMSVFLLSALLAWYLSAQVQLSEVRLLSMHYNYKLQAPQTLTMVAAVLLLFVVGFDLWRYGVNGSILLEVILCMLVYVIVEWLLALVSPKELVVTVVGRLLMVLVMAWIVGKREPSLLPFVLTGLFFRNSPLGVVHGKPFWLAYRFRRFGEVHTARVVPVSERQSYGKRFDVTDNGIFPDTGKDVLPQVQALIDEVGRQGGGTLFFPQGRYLFNKSGKKEFLQINYSHITLEGEYDAEGRLLTELVCCGTTVQGHRNPWLSPFFITTGEQLQPSNQFWGLDFRKPKGLHMESSSLSDPGSDGQILTSPFATHILADAEEGSSLLKVEDATTVGQYVLLGMYNTTEDAELLKEMLGVDCFRQEWLTAQRAGQEQAPSFQWLVEVKRIVDKHTIELVRPLLRSCLLKYEPALFNVEILEDIHLCHLRISSRWNGLFHHHGIPLYYSVGQAQEMDYGWNAINMKRVAHSTVEDVEIMNFANPIYVQDSREVTVQNIVVDGYDGHQGIKVYCHTCDCLFQHIDFLCHFADMMGGEGNAYANTFRNIRYLNPTFHPVDFDFHGFSEGPMSPPAYNLFEQVQGFRYIKGAGAVFMQPACGVNNMWTDLITEGERHGELLFYAMSYRKKSGLLKYVTAVGYAVVLMMKKKDYSLSFAQRQFMEKLASIDRMTIPRKQHTLFFPQTIVKNIQTTAVLE